MRRRDYQGDLFRRDPPWSWQAALRRLGIALAAVAVIMLGVLASPLDRRACMNGSCCSS
jgi:hypothetical protein